MICEGAVLLGYGKLDNQALLDRLSVECSTADRMAIEMVASFGMPVGSEVFDTCVWIGRFIQAWNGSSSRVFRRDVKLHLCGQARAKDGNVRQALIDRWGGKEKAIGTKLAPGPLRGVSADVWQALAVAVTFADGQMQTMLREESVVL